MMERSICAHCQRILEGHPGFCPYCGASTGYSGSQQTVPAVQGEQVLAGFWKRFAASLIDQLVLSVPFYIVYFALALPMLMELESNPTPTNEEMFAMGGTMLVVIAVSFLVSAFYFAIMEGVKGATLGKMALGLRVVDIRTGQPVGIGRGFGRFFGRFLSSIPLNLGYLWMLWDNRKQTWHDKMTSAVVIEGQNSKASTINFN